MIIILRPGINIEQFSENSNNTMDIEHVDIVKGEFLSLIQVANIVLRYCSICSLMVRGGNG